MTKDFSKYQKIIDLFRGEVSAKDFDAKFLASTKHLPKTETFLLKMELKRLASPCTRLIDLRGHVDGECRTFEDEDRTHFLDDLAIKSYEENKAYYGSYTFGVYEAVKNTKNNFRVIYETEKANMLQPLPSVEDKPVLDKKEYPATLYQFNASPNRLEERMNYAIPLTITFEDKEVIEATSSDISVHGCKFKLKSAKSFYVGQVISIDFVGLAAEFQFGQDAVIEYEVCNIYEASPTQLIGVKIVPHEANASFHKFLDNFIQSNKRRYKINLDKTISVLNQRILEHLVLPKTNELPVFIKKNNAELVPRFVISAGNNQHIIQYWQDEKNSTTLYCLLKHERLVYLSNSMTLPRSLVVYSFIHKNKGQSFFYTADELELQNNPEFAKKFLGFAASKRNFAVSLLNFSRIDETQAESPFALSPSLNEKNEHLNPSPSESVRSILSELSALVTVKDITNEEMIKEYEQFGYDDIDKQLLKSFGHKRLVKPHELDELGVIYKNSRNEMRFTYQTPALIQTGSVLIKGMSHDFSISGLKIAVDDVGELKKGDVVHLSFPSLQKITSSYDLSKLPYEVIQINHKVINLKVFAKNQQHIGRSFFKLLIDKNKDKLSADDYANMAPGLGKALRNLYAHSLTSPCLIVQTTGSRYKIETLTASREHEDFLAQMKQLSDRNGYYNLYPLLSNLKVTKSLYARLKKLQVHDATVTTTLYIAINHDVGNTSQAVTTLLEDDFTSVEEKKDFIQKSRKEGNFYCIVCKLCRTTPPDMEYLNPELSYISTYAIHRGKQIEQDMLSVTGIVQLFDITKEVLLRGQYTS